MDPPGPGDQGEASQPQPLDWRFAQVFGERSAGEDVQEGTSVLEIRTICGGLLGWVVPVGCPGAVGIGWARCLDWSYAVRGDLVSQRMRALDSPVMMVRPLNVISHKSCSFWLCWRL